MTKNFTIQKGLIITQVLVFLLMGCAPEINVKDIDNEFRYPNTGKLDIYKSAEEVKRPYKTIKIIYAEDDRMKNRQNKEEMKRMAFAKAKELGADGIIIKKDEFHKLRLRDGMGGRVPHQEYYMELEAIVYLDK